MRDLFGFRRRTFCPPCCEEAQKRQHAWRGLRWWPAVSALSVMILIDSSGLGWMARLLAFTVTSLPIVIAVHEGAHFIAALLLGYRVFRIGLGIGKPIGVFRCAGCDLELRVLPLGGYVAAAPRGERFVRLRQFLMAAAGPTANLALAVLIVLILLGVIRIFRAWSCISVLLGLTFANLFLFLAAVRPRKVATIHGNGRSDGLSLWNIPRMSPAEVQSLLALRYSAEVYIRAERGEWDRAEDWVRKGLTRYPGNPICEADRGSLLLARGSYEEAWALYRDLLGRDGLDPAFRFALQNNLAWAGLMTGDPARAEECRSLAAGAYEATPLTPSVTGTYGLALARTGEIDQAIPHLRHALENLAERDGRAGAACSLALAEALRGYRGRSQKYLRLACRLAPGSAAVQNLIAEAEAAAARIPD